ncbi:MAG: hypothetical protein NTY07_21710 [Bacteroidia bacterium]|nr:hypothetical protein [Bacteroidia bacterium]
MRYLITLIACFCIFSSSIAQKQKVWLDADTGNEMDDLYAIVRMVKAPSVNLIGLSSVHFNNPDLSKIETIITPPENTQRPIKAFISIDEKEIATDFWKSLK